MENKQYMPILRSVTKSYYINKFKEGATIVPRSFWFVNIKSDPLLGYDPNNPLVETEENRNAKKPYDKFRSECNIERQFLSTTILSTDLIPFGYLKRRIVIIPAFITDDKIQIISSFDDPKIITSNISTHLEKAEKFWQIYSPSKSRKRTIYERLNYNNGVTGQKPQSKFKVLYVTSATYMASCVVRSNENYVLRSGEVTFEISLFFVDHKTYYYDTDSEGEAYYLCAILNSTAIDKLIKPLQSKGSFGERDIHKAPLYFPIPKYDVNIRIHKELAELGLRCEKEVSKLIPSLSFKKIGTLRQAIRSNLKIEYSYIDNIVELILQDKKNIAQI